MEGEHAGERVNIPFDRTASWNGSRRRTRRAKALNPLRMTCCASYKMGLGAFRGQGADLLEKRGWDNRARDMIEA